MTRNARRMLTNSAKNARGEQGVGPVRVRIIGGSLRGSRLEVPELPGLRPTPDRLRETLFNWLRPMLPGCRALDLFAGTGALGIEALSQGANHVHFIETAPSLSAALRANLERLGVLARSEVLTGDFRQRLRDVRATVDLVFIDPPFADGLWQPALSALRASGLLNADSKVYLEWPAEQPSPISETEPFIKQTRVGNVRAGLIHAVPT